jgi:multidrug efflux pump subunit AcrA (membrane-fusion protein)
MMEEEDVTEKKLRDSLKRKQQKKKVRTIITWVIVLLILAFGVFLYAFYQKEGRLPWKEKAAAASTVKEVEAKVYENTYTTTIDLSGYVEAYQTQTLIFRSTGTITDVNVKEGDTVTKGESLASMDDTSQQYAIADLEAQIDKAKMNGSTRDLELLQMQLKTAENKLSYTKLYPNFDGIVASSSIHEGDYYEAGDKAMTVIDRSKLKATVEIDEIDMQYVHLGMTASLTFDSLPGQILQAEVTYIPTLGEYTSQGIGVKNVELTIENPPEALAPGYTFSGTISAEGETKLTLLPQSAVTTSRGTSKVTKKLEDGTKQTIVVTVKYLGEGICQLLTGDLKVGDTVIVRKTDTSASALTQMTTQQQEPPKDGGGGPGGMR